MNRVKFNIKDRRILYVILSVLFISIFTLTMAYAALSVSLKIQGNAEVVASSWDVHFDNLFFDFRNDDDYANIIDNTTIKFGTTLDEPGDKFWFTVDIVNEGTIDAIIESIEKVDDLTSEQAKYLKYDISYSNGESITEKQVLEANSYVRLIVNISYRSDVVASDLPTSQTVLNLSFKVNYTQKDEDGFNVTNNGTKDFVFANGGIDDAGSEVCLGNECFYLVEREEDEEFQLLYLFAKYNLNVGGSFNGEFVGIDSTPVIDLYDNPTTLQDSSMIGANFIQNGSDIDYNLPWQGLTPFSSSKYWENSDRFVYYDAESFVWNYVADYASYLVEQGYDVVDVIIPPIEFLEAYGCDLNKMTCEDAPEWISSTSYWLSSISSSNSIYGVVKGLGIASYEYKLNWIFGVRPIILLRDEK